MTSIEPPSAQERAYLDTFRDTTAMPDAARERVWARLAGGPIGPTGGEAANEATVLLAANRGPRWWSRPGLLISASVAVVSGAIVLGLLGARAPVEQPANVPVVAADEHQPPTPAAAPPAAAVQEIHAAVPEQIREPTEPAKLGPKSPIGKRSAPRVRSKPAPEPPKSSLADERRLIEQTHAALGRGRADLALELLGQHAREFEAGVFVQEREALLAIATCTAGQLDEGRAAAHRFLASYPHAVLAARVRKSCALGD